MIGYKQALLVLLLTVLTGVTVAQNNTNSPYTRYGYGQLADQNPGSSKAMGGVSYGLRDKYQTNFANPASYTAVDSLTFLFDGGISLQNTNLSNGTLKMNAKNSSLDYITMQFRASKWAAISLGLLPYSNVGYSMGQYNANSTYPEYSSTVTYSGEGGLHQLYLGAGFKILKNLSVGANLSYLWGDITRTSQLSFPAGNALGVIKQHGVDFSSYKLDLGVQYTQQLGKKHAVTLGAVFSPGHNLKNDAYTQEVLGTSGSSDATYTFRDTVATYGIPTTLGLGATYVYDNRLTVGADVMFQNWDKVTYMNAEDAFCQRTKVSVGAEFLPNPTGKSYFSHVKYRVGAYYSQPYYKITPTGENQGVRAANEYGVTAGFGLPIPRTRSLLSISAQYVRTQGTRATFLNENTLRVCIGVTFNERWFLKRKVH